MCVYVVTLVKINISEIYATISISQTWVVFCFRSQQLVHITLFATLDTCTSNNELIWYLGVICHLGYFLGTVFQHPMIPNQRQDSWNFTVWTEWTTYITNPLKATFTTNCRKLAVDILNNSYLFLVIGGLIWSNKERKYTIKFFLGQENIYNAQYFSYFTQAFSKFCSEWISNHKGVCTHYIQLTDIPRSDTG